jgi:hypothetical protein
MTTKAYGLLRKSSLRELIFWNILVLLAAYTSSYRPKKGNGRKHKWDMERCSGI